MEKEFLKGILFTLCILSLFGIVFAVGFHTASEVISGNFLGNYSFNGKVDFTNATVVMNEKSSSIAGNGWPDAIKCNYGSTYRVLYLAYNSSSSNEITYRQSNSIEIKIAFNFDGTYSSGSNMGGYDCADNSMSIQDLYDAEQAFNFVGGFN